MEISISRREFLVTSFLDGAIALVSAEARSKRLDGLVTQFFCLGSVDFLRQVEPLAKGEFERLVVTVFDRYAIPLNVPVEDYLRTVACRLSDAPLLERAMREGAEAFRSFWADSDTTAPLRLAALLKSLDGLNEEYERAFPAES